MCNVEPGNVTAAAKCPVCGHKGLLLMFWEPFSCRYEVKTLVIKVDQKNFMLICPNCFEHYGPDCSDFVDLLTGLIRGGQV